MTTPEPHHVFFTSKDDLCEDCIVIGFTYGSTSTNGHDKPIYYHFTTARTEADTVTKVSTGDGMTVARLEWSMHNRLGLVTICQRQKPMSYLVMRSQTPNARVFELNGKRYEWRRLSQQGESYELHLINPPMRLAAFRRESRDTPVGLAGAVMRYSFDDDALLLEALVALFINRWIELKGL